MDRRYVGLVGFLITVAFCALVAACGNDVTSTPSGPDPDLTPVVQPRHTVKVPGVSDERVLFGQSAAFTGPAQELGKSIRLGIEAAFNEVNEKGGVRGRMLELVSMDDAYEPESAIANTRHLIEEEKVFALIGAVGTPTSRSAVPVASEANVPYIAPLTGAPFLRDSTLSNVINLRASYSQETEGMVSWILDDLKATRIGVMYQDDSYGRGGYQGVKAALAKRGLEPVSVGLYARNTTAVKTALLDLRRGDPEAVIMIGAYEPVATLISWARRTGMHAIFMTVSFVGSNALADALGVTGAGVYVSQVVPFPTDTSVAVVAAYADALAAYAPDATPGFVSLEGYLAGRLAITGLLSCGEALNRGCFVTNVQKASVIDIDGFRLEFGENDNQGSDAVYLTVIGPDGGYHPVGSVRESDPWSTG